MQCAAFAQKFRREDDPVGPEHLADALGVADRHGRLDDHHRFRLDGKDVGNDRLDRARVERVGGRVVVGRRGNDHIVRAGKCLGRYQSGPEVQVRTDEIGLDLGIVEWRFASIECFDPCGVDVQRHHRMALRQQQSIGQTDVTGTGDGDPHAIARKDPQRC